MPAGDLAEGIALFSALGAAAAVAAWRIVACRLRHLDALERAIAAGLLFLAAIIAIHLLPLALGVLTRGTTLVCAAVLAGLAAALRPAADDGQERPRPAAAPSAPASWAVAALAGVAVATAAIANARDVLPRAFTNVDTLTFHLPNAARWIETGSLWQIDEYLPSQAHGYYPNNGEALMTWALLPFDNEFLVRFVFIAVLAFWALTIVAAARELAVAPAARVTLAAALIAVPIVGIATVPRAMPDVLLYATMTAGAMFLLRHARSGRTSDLLLAGLGLGLGAGTKWYGVSTFGVVGLVWIALRLRVDPGRWRVVARDAGVLAGSGAAACGIWLVRNLVESGNPLFPVKLAPLGITILDAPRDSIREQVGFSIAHYAGDPSVLGDLAGEVVQGAGWSVPVLALLTIVALIVGRRTDGGARAAAAALCALLLGAVYVVTPYTALGLPDHPDLANFNTRYLVPGLIAAGLAGAWVAGRTPMGLVAELALAATALLAIGDAYGPVHARGLATAALGGVAAAAALYGLMRVLPGARGVVVATAIALVGVAGYTVRTEDRFNAQRYAHHDPAFAAIEAAAKGGPLRIGVAGAWSLEGITPVWPSFGPRMRNHVTYVGRDADGFEAPEDSEARFVTHVRRERYDALVVGRGLFPRAHVREQDWARAAGFVEVTRSPRLLLFASPALLARARRGTP